MEMITGIWLSQALYIACKLNLPDRLAAGLRSAGELAKGAEAHPRALYRLMRALASVGVFAEDEHGQFSLTPLGECLRTDSAGSLRWLALQLPEIEWQPWGQALHSVISGETAFEHVFGMPLFAYLEQRPDLQRIFSNSMAGMAQQLAIAVTAAFDFSGARTVVDVGGGYGSLLLEILRNNPGAKGIIFDLPHVVAGAQRVIHQNDLSDRCECIAGSFFEAIPRGGDVYLMSYIIHDWDDSHSAQILKCCREAMDTSARLLLIEVVIPPAHIPSFGKLLDLEMLVIAGGQERTEQEYRELLDGAELDLSRVISMKGPQSIIEAIRRRT
jgi:hypothetical protein